MSKSVDPTISDEETPTVISRLWRHYMPLLRTDVIIASLVINLLTLGLPIITLQVYDRVIPEEALSTLTLLSLGLLFAIVMEIFLKSVRSWLAAWSGARYEHRANCNSMEKVMNSKLEVMEDTPAGIHLDRMTSVEPVRDFYTSQTSLILLDLPFALIFLAMMMYVSGILVLVPILLFVAGGIFALKIGKSLRRALTDRIIFDDRRFNFLIEGLGGIHTVKSMALEPQIERRYERLIHSCAEIDYEVTYLSNIAQTVSSAITQISMIAVVGFGSVLVIEKSLSIGGLAACVLLTGRALNPLVKGLSLWTRFQTVSVAEQKLQDMDSVPIEEDAGTLDEPINSVELRNISFAHDDHTPILNEINLSIRPGEIISIEGENGCGKSTLLHMLMGRLQQNKGQYLINGKDGHDLTKESRTRQIAYLTQRPQLLHGSILDNLTMFNEANLHTANDLVRRLGLDGFFSALPDGLQTVVGNTAGNTLPAGVLQRIAIARGLSGRPRLILFDDANSMLDGRSDPLLRKVIDESREFAAIVIVSYRPSLLSLADRRYEIKDGSLLPIRKGRVTVDGSAPVMQQSGKLIIGDSSGDEEAKS